MLCFFFFKQKTAYEMRISDWSSDVCSSDLDERAQVAIAHVGRDHHAPLAILAADLVGAERDLDRGNLAQRDMGRRRHLRCTRAGQVALLFRQRNRQGGKSLPILAQSLGQAHDRSEEHTTELQSLMRISY